MRASLAGFAADHMVGQSRAWASVPFELLSMDESFAAVEDIQRATTGEVLACHPVVNIDVDSPAYVELLEHQLDAGRAMRGLYPTDVLGDTERLAYVRHWADAGESVRLTQRVLPSVAVFGDEVALVNTRWSGDPSGTVLVRAPALVALVRALFDEYWARATPLPGRDDNGDSDELGDVRVVLELLQLGMKDETIARQLGVSLRTVRRRIAALMDDLGVATQVPGGPRGGPPRPDLSTASTRGDRMIRYAESAPQTGGRPRERPRPAAAPPPRGRHRHAVHRGQPGRRCCATATRSSPRCSRRSAAREATVDLMTFVYWQGDIARGLRRAR